MANELISIDALRVHSVPAVLTGNFQELNGWLDGLLADKDTVVTLDTLPDEKKELAALRKLAKEIDGKAKAVIALVSGDIDGFSRSMKELKTKVMAVADDKAAQVDAFEADTRSQIARLLADALVEEWAALAVVPEFRRATVDDLVKLTAITATGALTKTTQTAVKDKAQADFRLQTNTRARLMELENKCLKNDINPPLTRASVESILFADDATYYSRLDAMIQAEIERKAEAERRMKAKLDADKQREIEQALAAQKAEIAKEQLKAAATNAIREEAERLVEAQSTASATAIAEPEKPANAVTYTISALVSFDIQSRPNADLGKMKAYFTDILAKEGKRVVSLSIKAKEVKDAA